MSGAGLTNPAFGREHKFVTENTTTKEGTGVVEGHVDQDGITRTTDVTPGETVDHAGVIPGWVGDPGRSIAQPQPHLHDWLYLKTVVLNAGFVSGTPFAVQPYLEFMQLAYVIKVLNGRRVGRLRLELKFTAQPTAYHYGEIVFGWCPYMNKRTVTGTSPGGYTIAIAKIARFLMSRKHHVRLNLAKPQDCILSCPIPGPIDAQLLQDGSWNARVGNLGGHYAYVAPLATPARVDGAYTDVPLEIYVRLVEDSALYDLTTATIISAPREGPLSGLLRTGGDFLGAVGKITGFKILDPLAAFATLGAKGARAMGFGTPLVPPDPPIATTIVMAAAGHCDDQLRAVHLGSSATASRVVAMSGGIDEMSIGYVASQYSLLANYTFASTRVASDQLAIIPVDPSYNGPSGTVNFATGDIPTTLSWVSAPFRYWRGGIKYRVTVCGSKYHSGRIRIVFEPAVATVNSAVTLATGTHCFNEVIDIGERTVVEFEVPWSGSAPWGIVRNSPTYTTGGTINSATGLSTAIGQLFILCETPLTSIAAPAPSIQLVVEVAGGADYELAELNMQNSQFRPISAKAGGDASASLRKLGEGVPFNMARASCIGDNLKSLRDICKVLVPVGRLGSTNNPAASLGSSYGRIIVTATPPPYPIISVDGMGGGYITGASPYYKNYLLTTGSTPSQAQCPRNYFSVAYGEVSGGLRLHLEADVVNFTTNVGTDFSRTSLNDNGFYAVVSECVDWNNVYPLDSWTATEGDFASATIRANLMARHVRARLTTGPLDVIIPHTSTARCVTGWDPNPGLNADAADSLDKSYDGWMMDAPAPHQLMWWGFVQGSAQSSPFLSLAGAEDFNCAYFDGPPPCLQTGA